MPLEKAALPGSTGSSSRQERLSLQLETVFQSGLFMVVHPRAACRRLLRRLTRRSGEQYSEVELTSIPQERLIRAGDALPAWEV